MRTSICIISTVQWFDFSTNPPPAVDGQKIIVMDKESNECVAYFDKVSECYDCDLEPVFDITHWRFPISYNNFAGSK